MDHKQQAEKSLKRFLKHKLAYTTGLLISFLITGGLAAPAVVAASPGGSAATPFGEGGENNVDTESLIGKILAQKAEIEALLAENEAKLKELEQNEYELVREADWYAKPWYPSNQVLFSYAYRNEGSGKDRTADAWSETLEAFRAARPASAVISPYVAGTTVGSDAEALGMLRGYGPDGQSTKIGANGVITIETGMQLEMDLGVNITAHEPDIPQIAKSVTAAVTTPSVAAPSFSAAVPATPAAPTAPAVSVSISVAAPAATANIAITPPSAPTPQVPADKTIAVTAPVIPAPFEPRIIEPPEEPDAPTITTPTTFVPPTLPFVGLGFPQGAGVSRPRTNIIIQNYETYSTSAPVTITTGSGGTTWSGGNITMTTAVTSGYNPEGPGTYTLTPGSTASVLNAFINELRDHNATIGGDYDMTYASGTGSKIFLSHNPAGVSGLTPSDYDGYNQAGEKRAKLTGTLTLHGLTSASPGVGDVLIGVEHQTWDTNVNVGSWSTFENTGTITLASGKQIIGIQIDVESSNTIRTHNNMTINSGKIVINSTESIGIDFGNYNSFVIQDDVTIGDIEVNGTRNYGVRMKNLKDGHIANYDYYDDVTLTGGAGKKILVGGTENVGIGVGKSLSSNPNSAALHLAPEITGTNPISNFYGINIEIVGNKVIGFLRMADYSTNNNGTFLLDSQTMGTFNIGTGATNSTLIRTDNGEITIQKNITTTGTSGTGNTVAHANGNGQRITNAATITVNAGLKNTTGLAATGSAGSGAGVENPGVIEIKEEGGIGMYIDADSYGLNTGTISVTGARGNTGIANYGMTNFSGTINVEGEKSAGLYTVGSGSVNYPTTINAKNGATGVYAAGGTFYNMYTHYFVINVDDTASPLHKGLAVYVTNPGTFFYLAGAIITVKEGSAGIAAYNSGEIEAPGLVIDYTGDGYAIYSDGTGKINAQAAYITLRGNAVGYPLDMAISPAVITGIATIDVQSANAIGVNILNQTADIMDLDAGDTQVGQLNAALSAALGYTTFTGIPGYIQAALENGTFNINTPLNKATLGGTDEFFYRNLLTQALKLNVKANVTANLSSADAASNFRGQVSGLELSSSKMASGRAQTQINIDSGATVAANRTDSGAGAVGAFINYGELTNNGKIEVEKTGHNQAGVGVVAVDGSHVSNAGTIETDGQKGIGIFAAAYRRTAGGATLAGQEFGGKAGEGATEVTNSGTVTALAKNGVGIYLWNNSAETALLPAGTPTVTVKVENAAGGVINAKADDSIGIYAEGNGTLAQTQVANNGTIEVGKNGVAIFAENGTDVTKAGTLKLGEEAIGIILDKTSRISDTGTITAQAATATGNKMVVALRSTTGSNDPAAQTLALNIDTSALDKGTAIYVQNRGAAATTISSTGALTIGTDGVGIYVDHGHATNNGTITLDPAGARAVGMYSAYGEIVNGATGQITVNTQGQIGMADKGGNANIINNGVITLNGTQTTGIFVYGGGSATDASAGNIVFSASATNSFGIALENGGHGYLSGGTYTLNNSGSNIYVYATDYSDVTVTGPLIIDGVAAGAGKSVGIYLGNVGVNQLANNASLTAKNGSIGIYSTGAGNNFGMGTLAADGDKSIALYLENGGRFISNTTITADAPAGGNAVGIYGNGGTIHIPSGFEIKLGTSGVTGTGMYLTNGTVLDGSTIGATVKLTNASAATNVGIYYTGGGTVALGSTVYFNGNKLVGIYLDGGIKLTNTQDFLWSGTDNVGIFVSGNSEYVSSVTGGWGTSPNSVWVYVEDGKATNTASMSAPGNTNSVGMLARAVTAGKTAYVENTGSLGAADSIAMYLGDITTATAGTNRGRNSGTIWAGNASGIGVVVGLGDTKFDGTGGTIISSGGPTLTATGIYLTGTSAGQVISAGTIQLYNKFSAGVYAENGAVVDFPINLTGLQGIGLYADSGAVVSGDIDASATTDTVAVYLEGPTANTVTFQNNHIKTGTNVATGAAGLLLRNIGTYLLQNTEIFADGTNTAAVMAIGGTTLDLNTRITADNGAVGLYVDSASTLNANAGKITIGANAIGAYLNGGTGNFGTTGTLQLDFTGVNGIGIFSAAGAVTTLGGNIVVSGAGTLSAAENGSLVNAGTLAVANGSIGLLGQYDAGAVGYAPTYTLSNTGTINATTGGIGMAGIRKPSGVLPGAGAVRIVNSGTITAKDAGSVGIYSDVADIDNSGGTIVATDGGVGIYALDNARVTDFGDIQATKGTGVVIDGAVGITSAGTITVNSGDANHYSVGAFYRNVSTISAIPTINLAGDYAVALIAEGTGTLSYTAPIAIGSAGSPYHDQIFLKVQGDGASGTPITVTTSTVDVYGDQNIGIYADTAVLTTGDVHVYPSTPSADMSKASIGIYGKDARITAGDLIVDQNAMGIYGENVRAGISAGIVNVGDGAVGIYATGSGNHTETVTTAGTLTVGDNKALGIYGKDIDVVLTNNIQVGEKQAVGVVSEGKGDVSLSGNLSVAGVATKDNKDGGIALYKKGEGSVTSSGTWTIGTEGYGLYIEQTGSGAVSVVNSANITLGESAVAAYAGGHVNLRNTGHIVTGATNLNGDPGNTAKHLNSVGLYLKDGATGENAASGVIDVTNSHSVGVYGTGTGTTFTNNGVINVDNGGTGILFKSGAAATNNGTINILSDNTGAGGKVSVGMAAYGGAQITNAGTINAGAGTGMYVGLAAVVDNQGTINITDGVGITGDGQVLNRGTINVSGSGQDYVEGENGEVGKGSVRIDKDGNVYLNGNYVGLGGTVTAKNNVILDGAYLGLEQFTQSDIPVVSTTGVVSGDVRLLPSFTTQGNGVHWVIQNFTDYFNTPGAASKVTITTSPLFVTKAAGKDLILYKRPYNDLVIGDQFRNLYDGLDSLFADDGSLIGTPDFDMLTGWHSYLETVNNTYGETAYNKAFAQGLSELRGDVYATVQKRIESVQSAFDSAFAELSGSYNTTKDSGKYSVIWQSGKYADKTVGIDDYKYNVQGLLYMREFEGRNYGDKWGWYAGFAVGQFEFEDDHVYGKHSDERIYGVRLGVHGTKSLGTGDRLRLLTRLEGAYNRHETDRVIELDKVYRNKGRFDSYAISLDTKLEKTLSRSYKHKLDLYGGIDLCYGRYGSFTEGGDGLKVAVKGNDVLSVEASVGIKGQYKARLGKKFDLKLTGDLGYARELNDSAYKQTRARVADGAADYYELIRPERERGNLRGRVGLTIEKGNKAGVTFSVEARKHENKDKMDVRFGANFTYRFGL
jgi:hypothetical protein